MSGREQGGPLRAALLEFGDDVRGDVGGHEVLGDVLAGAMARAGRRRRQVRLVAAVAALVVLAAGITAVAWGRTGLLSQPQPATTGPQTSPTSTQLPLEPPATVLSARQRVGTGVLITGDRLLSARHRWYRLPAVAWAGLSPDGRYLVYRQRSGAPSTALVVRDLTAGTTRTVPTAAVAVAGWSQNSRWALLYDDDMAHLGAGRSAVRLDLRTGQTTQYYLALLPGTTTPGMLTSSIAGAVFNDGNLLLVRPTAVSPAPAGSDVVLGPVDVDTVNPVTGATLSTRTQPAVLPWRSQVLPGGGSRPYSEQLTVWLTGGTTGDQDLILETGHSDLVNTSTPPVWQPTSAASYDLATGKRLADLSTVAPATGGNLLAGGRTLIAVHIDGSRYQLLRVDPATGTTQPLITYIAQAATVFPGQPALPNQT
jgi:hypothetical protein